MDGKKGDGTRDSTVDHQGDQKMTVSPVEHGTKSREVSRFGGSGAELGNNRVGTNILW